MTTFRALEESIEDILDWLEPKKSAPGVYTDLKIVFDSVDHQLLCKRWIV